MVDLNLDFDEGILLQTTNVERYKGNDDFDIEEMYLTNKNLICVYDKSTGLFSKEQHVTENIPLSTIKVTNGKVQITKVDNEDYGVGMQILLTNGLREHYIFSNNKKELQLWIDAITEAIYFEKAPVLKKANRKCEFAGATASLGSVFNSVVDSKDQAVASTIRNTTPAAPVEIAQQPAAPVATHARFCPNCGTKLPDVAKFCQNCGFPVNRAAPTPPPTPPIMKQAPPVTPPEVSATPSASAKNTQRQQEYVGTILKCSICGAVISETTVVCPDCSNRITGRAAVSSVQAFKDQIMTIEGNRKKSTMGMFNAYAAADPADKQKQSLIRNFLIPNTVDDILEFIMLAIANIDISVSKKNWVNSSTSSLEIYAMEMPRAISNAWVAKMKQAYQKAEIMFPNDPMFAGIQKLYFDKMKELKIKIT